MKETMAIIGEDAFVWGFRGVGLKAIAVEDTESARNALKGLVDQEYPIVYITEAYAGDMLELIDEFNRFSATSIVIIPAVGSQQDVSALRLKNIIRRAVGTDTFETEEG
ncbi:MAG: V-type ATP synthase subunit F [bacterium]